MSNENTGLRILRLAAENFKALKLINMELDPEGGLVMITGKNGAGKTCCMDIVSACLGGKKLCPEKPIREGEKFAEIEVETEDWIVTRRFTEGGSSSLKVVKPDQSIIPKGQSFLDAVVGKIAFDPLEFFSKKDTPERRREQGKICLDIAGVDVTEINATIASLREQRTAVGRTLKQAEAEVEAAETFPDAPAEEISAGNLAKELQIASALNETIKQATENCATLEGEKTRLRNRIEEITGIVAAEQQYLRDHPPIDDAALTEKVEAAEETNRQVRANEKCKELMEHRHEVETKHTELNNAIEEAELGKQMTLNGADMPVEGLSVTEDGVEFNDIPIAQIATSEQMKVGMAIAMKLNPKLKVILIRDGSLLDSDNIKVIEDMVKEQGFQCLIECVSDGEAGEGFTIEDGAVKE